MPATSCGHEGPEGSRFCVECGAALPEGGMGRSTTVILRGGAELLLDDELPEDLVDTHALVAERLPAGSALLLIKRGPNAGSGFLLDRDTTTVGRHRGSDIFLDDITVSRRHVEFHREGGAFSLRDVGSLNGTYVNRKPVDVAGLVSGDDVQIGKFRFLYLTGPQTPESTASSCTGST